MNGDTLKKINEDEYELWENGQFVETLTREEALLYIQGVLAKLQIKRKQAAQGGRR